MKYFTLCIFLDFRLKSTVTCNTRFQISTYKSATNAYTILIIVIISFYYDIFICLDNAFHKNARHTCFTDIWWKISIFSLLSMKTTHASIYRIILPHTLPRWLFDYSPCLDSLLRGMSARLILYQQLTPKRKPAKDASSMPAGHHWRCLPPRYRIPREIML